MQYFVFLFLYIFMYLCPSLTMCNMECTFFNQQDVIQVFKESNVGKSSGPDKI